MAELKTKQHDGDVFEFINTYADTEQKRKDSYALVELMQRVSGYPPKMWGPSMIGFGSYHYKSERIGRKVTGHWWPFHRAKPPSRFMFIQGTRSMSICSRTWAGSPWGRPASILRSCRT